VESAENDTNGNARFLRMQRDDAETRFLRMQRAFEVAVGCLTAYVGVVDEAVNMMRRDNGDDDNYRSEGGRDMDRDSELPKWLVQKIWAESEEEQVQGVDSNGGPADTSTSSSLLPSTVGGSPSNRRAILFSTPRIQCARHSALVSEPLSLFNEALLATEQPSTTLSPTREQRKLSEVQERELQNSLGTTAEDIAAFERGEIGKTGLFLRRVRREFGWNPQKKGKPSAM
jgi:hypothetical protein